MRDRKRYILQNHDIPRVYIYYVNFVAKYNEMTLQFRVFMQILKLDGHSMLRFLL